MKSEQLKHNLLNLNRPTKWLVGSCVLLLAALSYTPPATAVPAQVCYIVADSGGGNGGNDLLIKTDVIGNLPDPFVQIGTGTGTSNIEAAVAQPGTNILFAANQGVSNGQLGTVDLITGVFTPTSQVMGSGDGSDGTEIFNDPDGLAFDPATGRLFATIRRGGSDEDLLIELDPTTGAHIPDAFGAGVDYVEVQPQQEPVMILMVLPLPRLTQLTAHYLGYYTVLPMKEVVRLKY